MLIETIFNIIFKARSKDIEWVEWHSKTLELIKIINSKRKEPIEVTDLGEKKFYDLTSEEILKFNYKPTKILEVGCGSGALSMKIKDKTDANIVLLDNSQVALNYAKLICKDKAEYICQDCMKLPFKSGCFDIIHSVGLIEHFDDLQIKEMLQEQFRVLKTGGILYIAVPNYFSPYIIYLWWKYRKNSERYISKNKLKKLVSELGKSQVLVCETSTFVLPRINQKIERLLQKIDLGFLNYIIIKKC